MHQTQLHATTIAIDGHAILLRGPSGSGKSDLALRLIHEGAILVADDYTNITINHGQLMARCPDAIRGRMEVRGLGLVTVPFLQAAPLSLVIDLVERDAVPRMPDGDIISLLDQKVPIRALHAFDHSAPVKVRLALQICHHGQIDSGDATAMVAP